MGEKLLALHMKMNPTNGSLSPKQWKALADGMWVGCQPSQCKTAMKRITKSAAPAPAGATPAAETAAAETAAAETAAAGTTAAETTAAETTAAETTAAEMTAAETAAAEAAAAETAAAETADTLDAGPSAPADRVGSRMEIQACDDDCPMRFCTGCVWGPCTVVADNGRVCDVTLDEENGQLCVDVIAHRFLRMPAAVNSRKRKDAAMQ